MAKRGEAGSRVIDGQLDVLTDVGDCVPDRAIVGHGRVLGQFENDAKAPLPEHGAEWFASEDQLGRHVDVDEPVGRQWPGGQEGGLGGRDLELHPEPRRGSFGEDGVRLAAIVEPGQGLIAEHLPGFEVHHRLEYRIVGGGQRSGDRLRRAPAVALSGARR